MYDIDGYYLNGMQYNTAKPFDKLNLVETFKEEIDTYINKHCTERQQKSLQNLYQLIQGFESPLGMELLSSIDLLIQENPDLLNDIDSIEQKIRQWSNRKGKLMIRKHLKVTLKQLYGFKDSLYQ